LHAIDVYRIQAERCEKARAFLAGCILQGALLEASLTAMAIVNRESVSKTIRYKQVRAKISNKYHRSVRWLRDFSLNDLERISKELGWIGGWHQEAKAIRESRNLIHIGKYADEHHRRINARLYRSQYSKLVKITDALEAQL
jgi:hypothetical protein